MQNKLKCVLFLLFIQIVFGQNNAKDEKLVTDQPSENDSKNVENNTDTHSFEKIKHEILQFVNLARNDIIKELQLVRVEMKKIPQIENLQNLTSKLETLATSRSVDTSLENLAHKICSESQEAIGSVLSEKLSTLASKDDLQSIQSITENYSNMLKYDISKLKDHVANSSHMLNTIEYTVTAFNHSMEDTAVQLKSIKNTLNENHKTINNITSTLDQTRINLTTGIDKISLKIKNVGTQNDIKQLYIRLANLSTTEVQLLRNFESSFYTYLNSINTDQNMSEISPKNDIAELIKTNGNKITSLNENTKLLGATINATGSSIRQLEENLQSYLIHAQDKSMNVMSSISSTVNITHTLLSKVDKQVQYINTNAALIPNAVLQRLGMLSFDVKELKKETEKISTEQIVEQVSENMINIVSNVIKPLQSIQQNISETVYSLVSTYNSSLVLDKLNDLAKETKSDTANVDLGIVSLNVAFDELMFQLSNFQMTIDNLQSDILEMRDSITINNNEVAVPDDNSESLESTIYSINGTLSSFISVIQTFHTDLDSCTSNISLVKNKLDEVHTDIDLIEGGIVSVNLSVNTVDKKISNVAELINPLVSKLDKLEGNMVTENEDLIIIDETVNLINEKLDVLEKISKSDQYVHQNLQTMQSSISAIKENTGNIKSFTSEVGNGISNIQGSIHLINDSMQNLQNTAQSINSTTYLIKGYTKPCQPPYFLLGDQCITIFEIKKTWMDARDHCGILGAQFLEVKQDSISALTRLLHGRYNGEYHIWIGASDMKTEGKFLWTSGNTVDLSWGWGIGQPNDWKQGEDCVELCSVHDDLMNDMDCNEPYYFACEK